MSNKMFLAFSEYLNFMKDSYHFSCCQFATFTHWKYTDMKFSHWLFVIGFPLSLKITMLASKAKQSYFFPRLTATAEKNFFCEVMLWYILCYLRRKKSLHKKSNHIFFSFHSCYSFLKLYFPVSGLLGENKAYLWSLTFFWS